MPPGSHTYWKMPGDAGVPPVFSFAGSRNVAEARVLYPTPRRITEAGLEAFGYVDHVTFPIVVKPTNPKEPAVLTADVSYAVCDKVCVPVHSTSSIDLASASGAAGDAVAVDAAFAAVPAPASPSERTDLSLTPEPGAAKPTWTVTWHGAEPVQDVFADAPQGFYFSTRSQGPSTWSLVAEETLNSKAAASVIVALTVARPAHPFVVEEKLDLATATR